MATSGDQTRLVDGMARLRSRFRAPEPPVAGIWFLTLGMALVAVTIALGLGLPDGPPLAPPLAIPWPVIAFAIYVAEARVVHLHIGRSAHSFSMSEIPIVAGLLFLSPGDFVLARLAGSFVALAVNRRQRPLKLAFNLAQFTLAAVLMTLVVHMATIGPQEYGPLLWVTILAAILLENAIGVAAVSAAISVAEGMNQFRRVPEMLRIGAVVSLTNASIALLGVAIAWERPSAALLVVIPIITAWLAYRAYVSERQQHESIEMLYESTRLLQRSPQLDAAMGAILEHARRMFRGDRAELYLLPQADDGEVLRSMAGPAGAEVMVPVPSLDDQPVFQPILRDRTAVLFRATSANEVSAPYRNAMLAPLEGESGLFGIMVVADRRSEISVFDESDLQLFELLANHTAVALENGQLEQSLTQLTQLKEELRHQAFHDALTGLANRSWFTRAVEERLAARQGPAVAGVPGGAAESLVPVVLFIDLDDFKLVNDTLGHAAGDDLLCAVGERITASLRDGDLAARLGGDEFAVLVDDTESLSIARAIGDRLIHSLGRGFSVGGREVTVRASIGIAAASASRGTADDLMRDADVAMYSAKAHGKSRVETFEPAMQMAVMTRAQLSSDLQQALAAGEFALEYQPIVDIATRRLVGVEALVRWDHPSRGRLQPETFIHVAEESNSIRDIGRWVLAEACARAAAWRPLVRGQPFVVSVNVAARELAAPDFVDQTLATIRAHGLEPTAIALEMTETAMMSDERAACARLAELRAVGMTISVDDFGTGYSSLSYLRQFPVTTLKIARDFVRIDERDPEAWALATAIVAMGRALGLDVIAEGVETARQLDQLERMGCAGAQGFYFARPLQADAITQMLRSGRLRFDAMADSAEASAA